MHHQLRNDQRQFCRSLAVRCEVINPLYGYPTLHGLLPDEGRAVNRKRTYRLYHEVGLQVRGKRRRSCVGLELRLDEPG